MDKKIRLFWSFAPNGALSQLHQYTPIGSVCDVDVKFSFWLAKIEEEAGKKPT